VAGEKGKYEEEFARQYNRRCGYLLGRERENRGISKRELSEGILDRTVLGEIEEGRTGWRKLEGDTLLQRMGVWPGCLEELAPDEMIDRWYEREDICLAVPARPDEAYRMLAAYREKHGGKSGGPGPVEEQFLLRAEAVLGLLGHGSRKAGGETPPEERGEGGCAVEEILRTARRAAACTMPSGWEEACVTPQGLDRFWLAPGELEAVLLTAAARAKLGQYEAAWKLQRAVWEYPKRHRWDPNVEVLILPQAALLGMELALGKGDGHRAFELGREALELLRRTCYHCHLAALLECLGRVTVQCEEARRYLERAAEFRRAFREIYEGFRYPAYRIWQGISIENTRGIGTTLRMLRLSEGIPRSKAVSDEEGLIITERQLEKVERGDHKPSYGNYRRLIKRYGKSGGWGMPLLETDSAEVLKLRQEIATLIGFGHWERAEWEIEKLREQVETDQPRVRQELLFLEAVLKWKREGDVEESLEMMLRALRETLPRMEQRNMKWWVFQQEEIIIASNIAVIYRKLGRMEEAEKIYETLLHSLNYQGLRIERKGKEGILPKGYEILIDGYDNLLADKKEVEEALKLDEKAIQSYLKGPQIRCLSSIFYRIAWNTYDMASHEEGNLEEYYQKWNTAFRISEVLAEYINDSRFLAFLKTKEGKYLN